MDVVGYRITKKNGRLDVTDYRDDDVVSFLDKVYKGFGGLVLFHGNPNFREPDFMPQGTESPHVLRDVLNPAAETRRCVVLIVSTTVIERPAYCVSPYIHFYSVGVPNEKDADNHEFVERLVYFIDDFKHRSNLPDQASMATMWEALDPLENRLKKLAFLELAICAQQGGAEAIPQEWRTKLAAYYRGDTYSSLRDEYARLCEEGTVKKN
jgi:hypothetical protein